MMNERTKKVIDYLKRYKLFATTTGVIRRTPLYAIHWYAILFVAIIVVLLNIVLASLAFQSVLRDAQNTLGSGGGASTINRSDLTEVLDTYAAQKAEFGQLQQTPPSVVDPGR